MFFNCPFRGIDKVCNFLLLLLLQLYCAKPSLLKMGTLAGTCEIEEVKEELNMKERVRKHYVSRQGRVYFIEDDINQLFDSVKLKTSVKGKSLQKNPMKRPVRPSSPQPYGIGISETVNLKQALRRLCISQASEMAALKMRSLKSAGLSLVSEVGAMNDLTKTVAVEDERAGLSQSEIKRSLLEISFPSKVVANLSETMPDSDEHSAASSSKPWHYPSTPFTQTSVTKKKTKTKTKLGRVPSQEKIVPMSSDSICEMSEAEQVQKINMKVIDASHGLEIDDMGLSKAEKDNTVIVNREISVSSAGTEGMTKTTRSSSQCLMNPILRYKSFVKRKGKKESVFAASDPPAAKTDVNIDLSSSPRMDEIGKKPLPVTIEHGDRTHNRSSKPSNRETDHVEQGTSVVDARRGDESSCFAVAKVHEISRSEEKAEFSQSSLSSNGEYSSNTTEESSGSGSSRCCNRPHMSKDVRWEAVHCVQKQHGFLGLRHFKLLKQLGSGDISTVYLSELVGTRCLFALKVMDTEFLARRKKLTRADTERDILQLLDHPFLPTLYAHFTTDKRSCLVMEHCPGGDLHVIRQKQPSRCFSEQAARFYVAEVLLALEYLHMLGIVYRDLKPENILVREDGHIMLSDFDLSLRCIVNPTLLTPSSPITEATKKVPSGSCSDSTCIDPFCIQASWQVSCFSSSTSKIRKHKTEQAALGTMLPQLLAEPTEARSNSFVGTHEYLAPEITKGEGHGSAVDWWTLGIFLYELLYGKTPFKGSSNDETLANVVSQPLKFPETPLVSFQAKDLIRRLLMKQPENRLGFVRGASEIKHHPFFEGLNWALIRCAVPPERPKFCDLGGDQPSNIHKGTPLETVSSKPIVFELF